MGRSEVKSIEPGWAVVLAGLGTSLAALFFWWAWRQGAYFGSVFYPGAIAVFLLLAILAFFAPFDGKLRGAALVALAALLAIAIWMAISLLWTPTQAGAIAYAQHAFLYVALFIVGIWICRMLPGAPTLALAPVAIAGIAVAVATTITIGGGHAVEEYLHGDATLRFPLGYRNANSAFFLICAWPALALAGDRARHWALRVAMLGGAVALVDLALLCQSRGSVPAVAIAMIAWIAFSPSRLRALALLVLVAVPVAFAAPTLLNVFQYGKANAGVIPLVHDSARAIALSTLGSLVLTAVCILWLEPRINPSPALQRRLGWGLGSVGAVVSVAAVTIFLVHEGGPTKFVDQRVDQFTRGGISNFSGKGARFGINVGSNRDDFWRVSLDQAGRTPILGAGAGSFPFTYLRYRNSPESPHDPHSVEMLMLDELGIPGLLLFLLFVGAVMIGAVRSRREGPGQALLVAGAATGVVQWTVHASYDWLWNYPILTGLMAFLAGVAVAPGIRSVAGGLGRRLRTAIAIAVAAILLALIAIPLFLSERYIGRALDERETNPSASYEDFDRAASLNPFDTTPLLAKGELAASLGERPVAIAALREAEEREPDNYAAHLFLAQELFPGNRALALREIETAIRLNPREPEVKATSRHLRADVVSHRQRSKP